MEKLLEIRCLCVQFDKDGARLKAVDGVDLEIFDNEAVALVGESGSGKTITALSITRILPRGARISSGKILFRGLDLLALTEKELENVRGKDISYVFQEAAASLNPVLDIGRQIKEAILFHRKETEEEASSTAYNLLKMVSLPRPEEILKSYPHQLSGGMNQRVMIAMALACRAKLLIADEPTTALDVTTEEEIVAMLLGLKQKLGFSILFITHNLHLARKLSNRAAIMRQGRIVEAGKTEEIFSNPRHEHTKALVNAIIRI